MIIEDIGIEAIAHISALLGDDYDCILDGDYDCIPRRIGENQVFWDVVGVKWAVVAFSWGSGPVWDDGPNVRAE
jgi:hypothetical protein